MVPYRQILSYTLSLSHISPYIHRHFFLFRLEARPPQSTTFFCFFCIVLSNNVTLTSVPSLCKLRNLCIFPISKLYNTDVISIQSMHNNEKPPETFYFSLPISRFKCIIKQKTVNIMTYEIESVNVETHWK